MSPSPPPPEPSRAKDAAEFVALLRHLRERSGLTYRALEQRAAEHGEVLPRSTLATVLRHDQLPRPELLSAFLLACGHQGDATAWFEARARIAAGGDGPEPTPETTAPPASPLGRPPRPRRLLRRAALLGTAVAVLGGLVGGSQLLDDPPPPPPPPRDSAAPSRPALPLVPGAYRIRPTGSGLCLGESTTEDSGGRVTQVACPGAVPTYVLEPSGGDRYLLRSLHPVFGHGCLGVDSGLLVEGAHLMNDYCGRRGTAEHFTLRPAPGTPGTFLLQPSHTDACVTVPGGIATPGASVLQLPCATPPTGQTFTFEPVPAPTGIPDITSN
ncbi:helix-turn-helix domain-containing protein [Kitasatospora sp. NPDC051853]|uniref:helix-turn-helix domain-containing protein n=1 Tax=Kitasatospora sp. NPDC051853 TaxID=3364058 RepID=UPI0037A608D7